MGRARTLYRWPYGYFGGGYYNALGIRSGQLFLRPVFQGPVFSLHNKCMWIYTTLLTCKTGTHLHIIHNISLAQC